MAKFPQYKPLSSSVGQAYLEPEWASNRKLYHSEHSRFIFQDAPVDMGIQILFIELLQ